MNKNNIMKWTVIAILTPLLFTACNKEWLDDVELEGPAVEDVYFADLNGLDLLVTGAYAAMNECAVGMHNLDMMYIGYGSIPSDETEAGGEQGGADQLDYQHFDQGNPLSSDAKAVADLNWAYNYKCIQRCNLTLKGCDKYRSDHGGMPADSAALVDRYEGEMRFLRAFVHFKLTQIYGGIIIVDHILGSSEYSLPRNSVAECLHFVQEELIKAIDLLPLKSAYTATEAGHATKGAAQALLAKAYLYESSYAEHYSSDARFEGCSNKYADALTQAQAVISSNQYKLVGIDGETFDTYWNQDGSTIYPISTPGFRYIFTEEGENSAESIFETQSINDGGPYLLSRGSYLTIYMTCRNTSNSTLGWGFNCPTEKLLNAYDTDDPRKIVTIAQTGDPVYITTGWDTYDCFASPTNMYNRKFERGLEYWGSGRSDNGGGSNMPYIRYADVILMAAEAALKANNDATTATTYVNMIRRRARNGAATGNPADLSSVTFNDVVNERLLELACEGHRFFDLVRWDLAEQEIYGQELQTYYGGARQPSPISNNFTKGLNEFFPLPLVETINDPNLKQYPGYQ